MICWVNGSFGAGKTTLTEELKARCPDALVFDPEEVGFMLRGVVPPAPSGDFQDLPAWRLLVVEAGRVLAQQYEGRLVIAPMTVVNPSYAREIFGGLAAYGVPVRHFFLKVPAARLRERITAQVMHPDPQRDSEVRQWRLAQVGRCTAAEDALPHDTIILDGELTPARLAGEVLEVLGQDARFAGSGGGAAGSR
jgi:hypothetical protein